MKLGIALSGGGIKGMAHAGVLRALEENGIKIDIIGGTSSGSLISSLYAMGYSPYYIYELSKRYTKDMINIDVSPIINSIKNFVKTKKFNIAGFITGENIEKSYNELANRKNVKLIKDIKMPLVIPAVDLKTSKKYVFTNYPQDKTNKITNNNENKNIKKSQYITDISIGKAVRASSSFPGVFCPCEYKEYKFSDGGILDNIPVEEIKKQGADKIIAVNFVRKEIKEDSNFTDISMRTIDMMGNKIAEESLKLSDYILNIQADQVGLLDIDKIDYCFKLGYDETIKNIEKIKSIIYS